MDILRRDLSEKKFTDFVLTVKDHNSEIVLYLHKIILYHSCEYFHRIIESNSDIESHQINVSNSVITGDIIMTFYDIQPNIDSYREWFYILETIKCRNYLSLEYDCKLLYNLKVPEEGFELLLEVLLLFDLDKHKGLIQTIKTNLPVNYEFNNLPKKIIKELTKKDLLATSHSKGIIKIWDLNNNKLVKKINTGNCNEIVGVQISRNNKYVVSDHNGREIIVCDIDSGTVINIITNKYIAYLSMGDYTSQFFISPNNKLIAILRFDWIYICKIKTGKLVRILKTAADNESIERITFSENSDMIAAINAKRNKIFCNYIIWIWNINTGTLLKTLTGKISEIEEEGDGDQTQSIKFVNNDADILVMDSYSLINKWNIESGKIIDSMGDYDGGFSSMIICNAVFSNNSEYFAEVRDHKKLKLMATGNTDYTLRINEYAVNTSYCSRLKGARAVSFSRDDKKLVVLGRDGNIQIISTDGLEKITELKNKKIICISGSI